MKRMKNLELSFRENNALSGFRYTPCLYALLKQILIKFLCFLLSQKVAFQRKKRTSVTAAAGRAVVRARTLTRYRKLKLFNHLSVKRVKFTFCTSVFKIYRVRRYFTIQFVDSVV